MCLALLAAAGPAGRAPHARHHGASKPAPHSTHLAGLAAAAVVTGQAAAVWAVLPLQHRPGVWQALQLVVRGALLRLLQAAPGSGETVGWQADSAEVIAASRLLDGSRGDWGIGGC